MPTSRPNGPLHALALVCTLRPSPAESSSDLLAQQVLSELSGLGVTTETIRVVDRDVRPGVDLDMGDGDEWPAIRERLLEADILLLATPIWLGQPSSIAQRVLERLDAELSQEEDGRPMMWGKVAVAAVVGNEDGGHHVSAIAFQALNDVGFTLPTPAVTFWNDEAGGGQSRDYKDLPQTPERIRQTTATLARNARHLADLLRGAPYPPRPD